MSNKKTIVIGLGGASNGGKTTTAERVRQLHPSCDVMSQDDYFWPEDSPHHIYDQYDDYPNYDVIQSFDMDTMMRDYYSWEEKAEIKSETSILIIEGILIYEWPELERKFDLKYFFTLPKDELEYRRSLRNYLPPTPPGYFEKCYWPAYCNSLKLIDSLQRVMTLDGTADHEQNCQKVCSDIEKLTNN